jgi:cobalt-zinc-cadmium efflux system membrane fusion protein
MNAEIELKNSKALTLPEEALVRFGDTEYIFIELKEGEFEMREVTIGGRQEGFVEVINSNQFQSLPIVVKGAYSLLMTLKNTEE